MVDRRWVVGRRWALAAATALGVAGDAAARTDAPCRVTSEIRPERATVGEQVRYSVRILRSARVERVEWEQALTFPGLRAEWLPGRAEDTGGPGVDYRAREEHRALFGLRAGDYEIAGATLRCRLRRDGATPTSTEVVAVPPVRLRVREADEAGRPADWSGVVGPVLIQTVATRAELSLGDSVRVSLGIRGPGNLWDLPAPFADLEELAGAEVFRHPPELDFERGERLLVRRFFRFDLVPRQTGRLVLPALRIGWYDPRTGGYEETASEPLEFAVGPRPASRAAAAPPPSAPAGAPERSGEATDGGGLVGWLAGGAVLAALAAGAAALRRRGGDDPLAAAVRTARELADSGDAEAEAGALARVLRSALALRDPALAELPPDALRRRADQRADAELREVARELEALDWIRFSDETARPDRDAVRTLSAALSGRRIQL